MAIKMLLSHHLVPVDVRRNIYGSYPVTPMGYFTGVIVENHSCGVSHGDYFAWQK
jgi:hypothetical protein